jgi:cell division protein FtsW (lipid II flippase)
MGVTYTTAAERASPARRSAILWHSTDVPLMLASVLAAALLLLAFSGRVATMPDTAGTLNLNEVADARALEPVFSRIFEHPGDGRLAAAELFAWLVQADGARRNLGNVGALSRVRIPVSAIDRESGTESYRARLAVERARAAETGRPAPEALALFTSDQIARLKPHVVVRQAGDAAVTLLWWGALYVLAFQGIVFAWRWKGIRGDRVLLLIVHLLTAVGFAAMISRPDPARDLLIFVRYAQGICLGLVIAAAISAVSLRATQLEHFSFLPLAGAAILSVVLIVFGSGPGDSNAKVNLGPVQPIEAIRLLLALFLAGYFAKNWEVLRGVRERAVAGLELPPWLRVPRVRYVVPVLLGVAAALVLFFFQRDLGPALMLALVFLAAWGVAYGRPGLVIVGLMLLAAGFYVGYWLEISSTLNARVRIWQSPWDNAARGGDQIVHALWAAATGGPAGAGLGLGDPRYVPAGETDLVLAAIAEELGVPGTLSIAALFVALIWRATTIAFRASSDYGFFLAMVLALFFAVPVLLVAAGILGLLPLTGVVTPFLSFGGSAMVANFAAIGLLVAIRSDGRPAADLDVFRPAVRWVGGVLATAAAVLLVAALRVQVVQADAIAVKPHLGMQADGSRRYQYNPRVLDAARIIPRGSVLDRNNLPLATDDKELLAKARETYAKLGLAIDQSCTGTPSRCYPLGGRAFHLLGDENTRVNWSASNTSYVERDHESQLRGFDDHQTSVRLSDAPDAWTVRRDYSDLLPILRHRRTPGHRAVEEVLGRPRDVRLTIDARLQLRVASILAHHASRSRSGHAAAVVLDAATGAVLASVSYPWPSATKSSKADAQEGPALLDRARYGLYPPGSTFKLVTAAAALLRDPAAASTAFTCARLDDGRVGARIKGWSRPIRDDVLDTRPHGRIDMHGAMVVSCNAYFAQLAASLGPGALVDAAERAGISVASRNATARVRDTLPQAGYGQGDVLASPLRMARIAAAIASNGTIRDAHVEGAAAKSTREFLPAAPARLLGSFMRDAVLNGTGRSVRGVPIPIAGKTGTAEVADAPSHAWFVGFAPYGPAKSRIAVAVIVENAGYGGTAAAPVAGEIVSAAAALNLVR